MYLHKIKRKYLVLVSVSGHVVIAGIYNYLLPLSILYSPCT